MGEGFSEDHDASGRPRHGTNAGVKRLERFPFTGKRVVAFVAPGHAGKPAIARMHILEIEGHHRQPVMHAVVMKAEVHGRIKGRCAPVQCCSNGPLAAANHIGVIVVEAESFSQ